MDNATLHTEGPWAVVPAHADGHHGTYIEVPDTCEMVCDLYFLMPNHKAYNFPNHEANARLIAAAPDMLEALKVLVAWDEDPPGDTWGMMEDNTQVLNQARAAIAKATQTKDA